MNCLLAVVCAQQYELLVSVVVVSGYQCWAQRLFYYPTELTQAGVSSGCVAEPSSGATLSLYRYGDGDGTIDIRLYLADARAYLLVAVDQTQVARFVSSFALR